MLIVIENVYRKHWESFAKAAGLLSTLRAMGKAYDEALTEACEHYIEPQRLDEAIKLLRCLMPESGEGEHPNYPQTDWKYEINNGDTRLGYKEWVAHRLGVDFPGDNDKEKATNKPFLAVVLEGGLVQSVISDRPDYFKDQGVMVIDYDTSDDDTVEVPQGDGIISHAYVSGYRVTLSGIDLKATSDNFNRKYQENILDAKAQPVDNSRLIEAARDMYDLLEAAIKRIELANTEGDPILSAWLHDARKVMAQIEGGE